jgi:hypothetical protein
MMDADCPFGQGMLYLETDVLCVTCLIALPVMAICLSIARLRLSCHLTKEVMHFLEAVVESLCLLPMRTPLIMLVFILVRVGVVMAGMGDEWCLFVGTDDNHYTSTRGRCAVCGVTANRAGSTVSMVVYIGVFCLVCYRWLRDIAQSILFSVGLPEDVMLPPALCGTGLTTL